MKSISLFVRSMTAYSLFLFSFTLWAPTILLLHKLGIVQKTAFQSSLKLWGRMETAIMPCTLNVKGLENIDTSKNYVFILNHQSIKDITLALGYIPINFVFLAKKELASFPVFGPVMKALQFIPIDRKNPKKAHESLKEAGKLMAENNLSLSIFAEGTRTKTGKVGSFKKGGFIVAAEAGVPIVPVSIKGNFEISPKKALLYQTYGLVTLTIHEPIEITHETINEVKDKAEQIIREDVECD